MGHTQTMLRFFFVSARVIFFLLVCRDELVPYVLVRTVQEKNDDGNDNERRQQLGAYINRYTLCPPPPLGSLTPTLSLICHPLHLVCALSVFSAPAHAPVYRSLGNCFSSLPSSSSTSTQLNVHRPPSSSSSSQFSKMIHSSSLQ